MILTADCWRGAVDEQRVLPSPDWIDVEAAIKGLDSETYTLVTLTSDGVADFGNVLAIAGGPWLVTVAWSAGERHRLLKIGDGIEMIDIVTGGQEVEYPSRNVVPIDAAIRIAGAFLAAADLGTLADWDE